jgi:hypothetical protein
MTIASLRGSSVRPPLRTPEEGPTSSRPSSLPPLPGVELPGISGVNMGAAHKLVAATVVVYDRWRFNPKDPTAKPPGILAERIEQLGGDEAARAAGIKRHRSIDNLWGLVRPPMFDLDVLVDSTLSQRRLKEMHEDSVLVFPAPPALHRALLAKNVESGSIAGVGTFIEGDRAWVSMSKTAASSICVKGKVLVVSEP